MASIKGGSPTALLPWINIVLSGALQQLDAKIKRCFSHGWDFVGVGGVCAQMTFVAPEEFFTGQPSQPLDKGTFDLTFVNRGNQRMPHIV